MTQPKDPSNNVISLSDRRPKKVGDERKRIPPDAIKLLKISDEIDQLIVKHVQAGDVDLRDLAGLLSHRLGSLMRHLDEKDKLLPVCVRVLKKQAAVE